MNSDTAGIDLSFEQSSPTVTVIICAAHMSPTADPCRPDNVTMRILLYKTGRYDWDPANTVNYVLALALSKDGLARVC